MRTCQYPRTKVTSQSTPGSSVLRQLRLQVSDVAKRTLAAGQNSGVSFRSRSKPRCRFVDRQSSAPRPREICRPRHRAGNCEIGREPGGASPLRSRFSLIADLRGVRHFRSAGQPFPDTRRSNRSLFPHCQADIRYPDRSAKSGWRHAQVLAAPSNY